MAPHPTTLKTYGERAAAYTNPTAKSLLEIMERKKTNLCVSVDVTTVKEVLEVVTRVGASVCMVKVGTPSARLQEGVDLDRLTAISLRTLLWTLPTSS